MRSLVEMKGINKSFAGVMALQEAELSVAPGEVHAIIGQNGAGKSTLIKVLTGVYRKDSGLVRIDGEETSVLTPRQVQNAGIATIYQELNLVPLRSVTENVMMGYEPRNRLGLIDWNESNRRTKAVLQHFGIDIDVRAELGAYSTAIQQLVAIARAVSLKAKLVIMDEATSSLDDQEIETLFRVVRELKQDGVAVLYISHFLEELFRICDRVTVMRDGRTVACHEMADVNKLDLISEMLGRDPKEIEAAGMTGLVRQKRKTGEILCEARSIATKQGLKNFSVAIRKGEVVGLGGLLGSGRTEAARAIFGADSLTRGTLLRGGKKVHMETPADAIASGIGFLTEDRKREGVVPQMSVSENITLALLPKLSRLGRIDRKREKALVSHYIDALGIKTTGMEQPVGELSGGNQQKVLLARWMATEPELLLLDEPTRGVDVGAKFEIQSIIRKFVDRGLGVLLISSEFEELVEGADRVVIMEEGHSVSELENPGITEEALIAAIAHSAATPS